MLVKSAKLRSVEVGGASKVLSYVGVVMLVKSAKLQSVEVGEASKVTSVG